MMMHGLTNFKYKHTQDVVAVIISYSGDIMYSLRQLSWFL